MGTFYTAGRIENIVNRERGTKIPKMLVDTGSEYTWVPAARFVMQNNLGSGDYTADLPKFKPILDGWIKAMRQYIEEAGDKAPWQYRERAAIGFLVPLLITPPCG